MFIAYISEQSTLKRYLSLKEYLHLSYCKKSLDEKSVPTQRTYLFICANVY